MPHRRLPLFQAVDAAITAFQDATGLGCPTGCGHCCETQTPYVSVADMLPIARDAVARGDGDALYDQAVAAAAAGSPCVIFEPGRLPGGCTRYELRPMLCRLFGFAAVKDKHGQQRLALCRIHARDLPEASARATAHVDGDGAVPIFAEWQAETDALDPDGSREQLPINEALARALERELLRARYAAG
jgi:Fe-S-cluster containining protein